MYPKEQKNLYVTELGEVVNNIMKTGISKYCGCKLYSNHGRTSGLRGSRYQYSGKTVVT